MATGQKLADAYVEVHADDSKLRPEVKAKATRVGREFGGVLNTALKRLNLDPIDIKASPQDALRAIALTRGQLESLAERAETVEIKVKVEKALGDLGKFEKRLGDVATPAAEGFTSKFGAQVSKLIGSTGMNPAIVAAVGAGAAAAAPLLGAAIAGGIIGGVGIGGVIGGFQIVKNDTRVKSAADDLAGYLKRRLEGAAGAFIGPALTSIGKIQQAVNKIDLEKIFRDASRFVAPLVDGVTTAVDSIGTAIERLVANAGPVVQSIGTAIGTMGETIGEGLASLSDNADSAATALDTLFGIINFSLGSVFQLVNLLTELYEISHKLGFDTGLQLVLKGTGAAMDSTKDSAVFYTSSLATLNLVMENANDKTKKLKEQQAALKVETDKVKAAEDALKLTLDGLSTGSQTATLRANALKTAMDSLYGATVRNTEANEAYEEAFDGLSEAVEANKGATKSSKDTLDIHTKAGRSNRDALQALLTSNNELYLANINAGQSVDSARKKHEARTEAVRKEAEKVGLDKDETDKLINTYGRIPPGKTTKLVVDGVDKVVAALKDLYVFQRALAEGIPIASMIAKLKNEKGPAKKYGGYAHGGQVPGWSPSKTADNIPATVDGKAGVDLTAREWVHPVSAVDYYGPRFMKAIQQKKIPREITSVGYAAGGVIAPVDTSLKWPFRTSVGGTQVLTRAQAESKVAPSFGRWPSSPSAQRGDSGVWRRIMALVRGSGIPFVFGNSYRPGDPKWHGSGRAIDFMGYNQDRLARFFMGMKSKVLELIHRTNNADYGVSRGRNNAMPTQWPLHRNHLHIAMKHGGQVPDQFAGVTTADNGRMTLGTGWNLVGNGTGRPEHMALEGPQRLHPDDIDALAKAIGVVVAAALLGTIPATRIAARQAGRPVR